MTKLQSQPYDFDQLVAQAREEYPEETKDITFVNLATQEGRDTLQQWIRDASPEARSIYLGDTPLIELDAETLSKQFCAKGCAAKKDFVTGKSILVMNPQNNSSLLTANDPTAFPSFAFYHELGHLIVPGGTSRKDPKKMRHYVFQELENREECLVDTFACLYALRNGFFDIDDIKALALSRAMDNIDHLTTYTVDHLAEKALQENLSSLTPQQIKQYATQHVAGFQIDGYHLEKIADAFNAASGYTHRILSYDIEHGRIDIPVQGIKATPIYWGVYLNGIINAVESQEYGRQFNYIAGKILHAAVSTGAIDYLTHVELDKASPRWGCIEKFVQKHPELKFLQPPRL